MSCLKISDTYSQLKSRVISINSDIKSSKRNLNDFKDRLKELKEKRKSLGKSHLVQSKAVETVKEIIEKFSREHIKQVEDLISAGLQTIYFDRDFSVEILVEDKRNYKSAEVILVERKNGKVIKTSFDNGVGGGVETVVGFILQTFYIEYFNKERIVWCDESFTDLSDEYVSGLFEFLNKLSEKKGFKFVLISHDNRLKPYGDWVYVVDSGEVDLVESRDIDGNGS